MIRLAGFAVALSLSGCGLLPYRLTNDLVATPPAPSVSPAAPVFIPSNIAPKERLVAAIAANGCVLTAANVDTILLQAQLMQPELRPLTNELAAEGRAEVSGEGTIRVLTETCI